MFNSQFESKSYGDDNDDTTSESDSKAHIPNPPPIDFKDLVENLRHFATPHAKVDSDTEGSIEHDGNALSSTVEVPFVVFMGIFMELVLKHPRLSARRLFRMLGLKWPMPRLAYPYRSRFPIAAKRAIGVRFRRRAPVVRDTQVSNNWSF